MREAMGGHSLDGSVRHLVRAEQLKHAATLQPQCHVHQCLHRTHIASLYGTGIVFGQERHLLGLMKTRR